MILLVLAASLLMGCTNLALGREESVSEVIHVTRKVLCQDCSKDWNEWVHGDKPIKEKKLNPKFCWVRLVSSPHPTCNLFTNFGCGHSSIKLGNPTGVYRDSITYKLGLFYYTTLMRDNPDTSDDQSNYHDNNGN
ncbi:hypothetical protein UlMin_033495 [Ulmus minor]